MRVAFELDALPPAQLRVLLEALTMIDTCYLAAHPRTPELYRSGVRYVRETGRAEVFQDVASTIKLRTGDCEDLACWRVAELRRAGETRARPALRLRQTADGPLYHVLVRRGNGALEDPSRILGMRGPT